MPKTDLATVREKLSDIILGVHDFMLFTGNATLAATMKSHSDDLGDDWDKSKWSLNDSKEKLSQIITRLEDLPRDLQRASEIIAQSEDAEEFFESKGVDLDDLSDLLDDLNEYLVEEHKLVDPISVEDLQKNLSTLPDATHRQLQDLHGQMQGMLEIYGREDPETAGRLQNYMQALSVVTNRELVQGVDAENPESPGYKRLQSAIAALDGMGEYLKKIPGTEPLAQGLRALDQLAPQLSGINRSAEKEMEELREKLGKVEQILLDDDDKQLAAGINGYLHDLDVILNDNIPRDDPMVANAFQRLGDLDVFLQRIDNEELEEEGLDFESLSDNLKTLKNLSQEQEINEPINVREWKEGYNDLRNDQLDVLRKLPGQLNELAAEYENGGDRETAFRMRRSAEALELATDEKFLNKIYTNDRSSPDYQRLRRALNTLDGLGEFISSLPELAPGADALKALHDNMPKREKQRFKNEIGKMSKEVTEYKQRFESEIGSDVSKREQLKELASNLNKLAEQYRPEEGETNEAKNDIAEKLSQYGQAIENLSENFDAIRVLGSKHTNTKAYETVSGALEDLKGMGELLGKVPEAQNLPGLDLLNKVSGDVAVVPESLKTEQKAAQKEPTEAKSKKTSIIEQVGDDNAKKCIEELQRASKDMPPKMGSIEARVQMRKIALRILATRIGVDSQPGKAKTLDTKRNQNLEGQVLQDMQGNTAIKAWLINTPYEKLRKLTLTGHGGEMEKDVKKFLCLRPKIERDTPKRFMPTAKMRCEGLQMQIKEARKSGNLAREVELCKELFITREAVGAMRGGEGLSTKLTGEALEQARVRFENSPSLKNAFQEVVADPKQRDAVLSGHGGAFKQKVDVLKNEKEMADAMEFYRPKIGEPEQGPSL